MKITITSNYIDPDDQMIEFRFTAETPDFKGATTIYGYQDAFKDFANQILTFPFEMKNPVIFEGHLYVDEPCLRMEIILREETGLIDTVITLNDGESGNSAKFSDSSMRTQTLHDFARTLLRTDFTQMQTLELDG